MSILKVNNVYKSFNKTSILKDINFSINEGEIVGFVGPNGAGKTTTLKVIANLLHADKGNVIINGHDISKEREKALENISAVIENPGLYKTLSGKENMDFIRKIRGMSKEEMNSIIKFVKLEDRINDKVRKYSLGMKQRLALGMCLLSKPKLLILDEPTNGLDPDGAFELIALLKKLSSENKMSVLISSHILSDIEKLCNKVIFIKKGEIASIDEDIKKHKVQTYELRIEDIEKSKKLFSQCEFINEFKVIDKNKLIVTTKGDNLSELLKILATNNLNFSDVNISKYSVEDEYNNIYKE